MHFEPWTHLGARMAIDADNLFREVVRVRQAIVESNDDHLPDRLKSLEQVLDEMVRINKALRLGSANEKLVALLNDWTLAGEKRLTLDFDALHAYSALAGVRIKPSLNTSINWRERLEMESWLRTATVSDVLQPNISDIVVFSRTGQMGIMHVLGPLSFINFKKWVVMQPARSVRQVQDDLQQIHLVEQLIAADLLSSTYDQY